ncbi:MAG: hypothetical protein A4S16_05345 [Proteobacteria bacterium SG_bin6]|nr:MAG: hypothetical protein A4S16_05345 [Proteobacteria bacterium SG_bin6]
MSPRIRSWARSLYWLLLTLAACAPPAVRTPQLAAEPPSPCADADRTPKSMFAAFAPQAQPTLLASAGRARDGAACNPAVRAPAS